MPGRWGAELFCIYTEKPRSCTWADPVSWEDVVPGMSVLINQKNPQIVNGRKSSHRQEPHKMLKPVKLLSLFRFSAKLALVGPGFLLHLWLTQAWNPSSAVSLSRIPCQERVGSVSHLMRVTVINTCPCLSWAQQPVPPLAPHPRRSHLWAEVGIYNREKRVSF